MAGDSNRNTIYARRDVLRLGAGGAVALAGLGAVAPRAVAECDVSPSATAGPFWVDEMLNRADIRSDPRTGAMEAGLPMRLRINVSEISTAGACAPLSGAWVDVWHTNAAGTYSDESSEGTKGKKFLRGYQVTDGDGNARFLTIYPGWYPGRTVHIHFRVRRFSGVATTFNFVSQLYFDDAITNAIFKRAAPYSRRPARDAFNADDGIYGANGARLLLRLSDNGDHVVGSFDAVIDSVPGSGKTSSAATPLDADAAEHAGDPGGGTPPLHPAGTAGGGPDLHPAGTAGGGPDLHPAGTAGGGPGLPLA